MENYHGDESISMALTHQSASIYISMSYQARGCRVELIFVEKMVDFANIQPELRENGTICCGEQTETDIGN